MQDQRAQEVNVKQFSGRIFGKFGIVGEVDQIRVGLVLCRKQNGKYGFLAPQYITMAGGNVSSIQNAVDTFR